MWRGVAVVSLLSGFALAVQGFHPYAEDGGLYVAGIKKVLDPGLYPVHPEFVLAHLRFSPFAGFVAALTHMTHMPLPWVLLVLYCASIWATLCGGWMLASRCTESVAARCGATALLACWLTMPIAGTSLILLDPYVTARSISTPLALFALAWAMDALNGSRPGALLCAVALILAMVHPLMAGYALGAVVTLLVVGSPRAWIGRCGPWTLAAIALLAAAAVQVKAPPETPDYVWAAMTRYYWFPLRWQWYEQVGLVAPLLVLFALGRGGSKLLARTAIVVGMISLAVALIFARAGLSTHLVARLQPLRCFQIVYEVMILLLGAWLGERWLKQSAVRWSLVLAVLGGVMFFAQRSTYPGSAHIELPWVTPRNPWSRAFLWIRDNTPKDAVFALDARYITRSGEDAQGFRGIAERSVLPDYSKDGGEASITPQLAAAWAAGQAAQTGIERESDDVRAMKLKPYGVSWVVLEEGAITAWDCPYRNEVVKVCRVR